MLLLVAVVLPIVASVMPPPIAAKIKAKRLLPPPTMRRAIRLAVGLSQSDVAEILGVHRETIARWESGDRTPRGATLIAYVELLDQLRSEAT